MAVAVVVSCPECEEKIKPKGDVQGKRIKCPSCKHSFVVPAAKNGKEAKDVKQVKETKGPQSKSAGAKAKPEEPKAPVVQAAPEAPEKPATNLDVDFNPYVVTAQDLSIRCPNCAQEMASAHAIICTFCGYNTMLRTQGKTKKVIGLTFQRHLMYLLPAIGSAAFSVFIIAYMVFYAVAVPFMVAGSWMEMFDSEAMRMWGAVFWLFTVWVAGMFCFKKFIEQPKPDDITLD